MGRSIPPLQQLPHGLIENRIAPQRQHITHGKHITHDNQHINKQHEHQPIGEAMTNRHAEDGDKKSILDARIERAYANEYDAAFAAATIKNYASLPLATILADHPQLLKRCTKIMGDPDIRKLTDPYAPKRDNDSYVLTVGCLAHMLTALDTKLKLEWEPDERHELESKRNTLRTALFLPLDGLKRCNVELNTQARQKPGTTGQKTPRPHAAIVDRNRYNRMTAHFSAEGAAIRTLIDLLCLLSINELFEGYLALVPATAPKSVAKIIETCRRQFERHRNGSERTPASRSTTRLITKMTDVPLSSISCGSPTPRPPQRSIALEPLALASRTNRQPAPQPSSISGSDEPCSPPAPPRATILFHNTTNRKESSWTPIIPPIISPLTMRESARGITLTSIYDEMLARRELSVMGNIETPMAHDLCQQIRLLDATDPSRPITIFVASAGGSVRSGLAIYDAMRLASCPIRTVCLEFAASMGAVIFMGGDDRRMAPHAELMIHDPLIPQGAGGSALALQETSRRLMQTRKTLTQILSDRSGLTPKRIQSLTAKDTYLSAERAVELGFAHEILSTTKEVAHV